jgi:hypothetical protein
VFVKELILTLIPVHFFHIFSVYPGLATATLLTVVTPKFHAKIVIITLSHIVAQNEGPVEGALSVHRAKMVLTLIEAI